MSSLPLIGTRAKYSTSSIPTLIVSHIQAPMHLVNSVETHGLKSFIDLSEQLRKKYVGQTVLMHAVLEFELPTGTVGND